MVIVAFVSALTYLLVSDVVTQLSKTKRVAIRNQIKINIVNFFRKVIKYKKLVLIFVVMPEHGTSLLNSVSP